MSRTNRSRESRIRPNRETEKWQRQLRTSLPLVGGWLRLEAARLLKQAADQGNSQAALILTLAYADSPDERVREVAREMLEAVHLPDCKDAVWTAWIETRHPDILRHLLEKNWVATAPPRARVYSALRLERLDLLIQGNSEIVGPLISASQDQNESLALQAVECLENLQNQEAIDAVCELWARERSDFLESIILKAGYTAVQPGQARCLTALLNSREEIIRNCGPDIVAPLIQACHDSDPTIAGRAKKSLDQLSRQDTIDAICKIWVEKRQRWLGDLIRAAGYVAAEPPLVRTITSLKTGIQSVFETLEPECVPVLVEACQDQDPSVRKNALPALQALKRVESQEAVCALFCEKDHPLARRIAIEQGYEPRSAENRALFFFLTDQWERYESLDFDRSLLRAVYETSSQEIRHRVIRKLQQTGRTDYLTVVAGSDFRSRAAQMTDAEIETLVKILTAQKEWTKLWALVFELSPVWSIRIALELPVDNWLPDSDDDREVFAEATRLAQQIPEGLWTGWDSVLPLAQLQSRVRVTGRINDAAFSPVEPVIAIATGSRKVVLWDFQKAEIRQTISGFQHSVGKVAYLPDGALVCSERTVSQEPCGVYLWEDNALVCLGQHRGTVTALEPAGKRQVLSTGRDQKSVIWDLGIRAKVIEIESTQWARQARVSPGMDRVVFLDKSVRLLELPHLDEIARSMPRRQAGNGDSVISRCAAFIPNNGALLVGKLHGAVIGYAQKGQRLIPEKHPVLIHHDLVQGIEYLPDHDLVISASVQGDVRFMIWSTRTSLGSITSPGERLTSLCVSPDGAFMATGDSDASLSLWDLRVMDLPALSTQPFCRFTMNQVTNTFALASEASFHPAVQAALDYMQLILSHRSRYDIQIDAAPTIQAGDFDIYIE